MSHVEMAGRRRAARVAVVVGVAAGVLFAAGARAEAAPTLTIVPRPASPFQTVTVFGRGFCGSAGCPRVQVTIEGRLVASAPVAADGSFRASFAAPSIPNQYSVSAEQLTSPPERTTTGLLVVPNDVPPGSRTSLVPPGTTAVVAPPATTGRPTATVTPPRNTQTTTHRSVPTTSVRTATTTIAPPAAASAPNRGGGGGSSIVPWLLGGLVLVLALAAISYRLYRRNAARNRA